MIGECEMTGRRNVELFRVKIEGTMMNVCKECIKYGEQIDKPRSFRTSHRSFSKRDENEKKFIVKDYAMKIKQARESKNLKQSEMAKKLNEKESLIHNIESNHMKPSFPLAKKIERFLGITLFETIEPIRTTQTSSTTKSEELTMESAFLKAMKSKKK